MSALKTWFALPNPPALRLGKLNAAVLATLIALISFFQAGPGAVILEEP